MSSWQQRIARFCPFYCLRRYCLNHIPNCSGSDVIQTAAIYLLSRAELVRRLVARPDTTPCHCSSSLPLSTWGWVGMDEALFPTSLGSGLDKPVAVAVQFCRQSSAKLVFSVYDFQSFAEACRYLSETSWKVPVVSSPVAIHGLLEAICRCSTDL